MQKHMPDPLSDNTVDNDTLVLICKPGERIKIGNDITIELTQILSSNKVRLSIRAPIEVPVHRKEIWDKIQEGK